MTLKAPPLTNSKKLLAINFGGIGDEILFLPTLKAMRQAYPNSPLTLLLEPRSQSVKQITHLVDEIITFDIKKRPLLVGDLVDLVSLIRDGGYELTLSSGSSKMVAVLLFLSGGRIRIGYDSGPLSRLLLTRAVPLNQNQYAADMYLDLARWMLPEESPDQISERRAAAVPHIDVPLPSVNRMNELLQSTGTVAGGIKKVLLHPGTSRLAIQKGIIKTWPVDNWVRLIEMLGAEKTIQTYLAGGPDDKEIVAEILGNLPANSRLVSCIGQTHSLADLAALIYLCDLLVCVDSAPMHIAVAAGKRVSAMFGPTDEKKLLPLSTLFKSLRAPSSNSAEPAGEPGVQLQPGTVFRSVLDQLQELKDQESSPALHLQ